MNGPKQTFDEEYVEARRVLLDALGALGEHIDAIVVAGAQAIYPRPRGRSRGWRLVSSTTP